MKDAFSVLILVAILIVGVLVIIGSRTGAEERKRLKEEQKDLMESIDSLTMEVRELHLENDSLLSEVEQNIKETIQIKKNLEKYDRINRKNLEKWNRTLGRVDSLKRL
jgi:FtsZ-binding cell division protein ZapB